MTFDEWWSTLASPALPEYDDAPQKNVARMAWEASRLYVQSESQHGLADAWNSARAIDLTANPDAASMVQVGDIMAATLRMMAKENGELFAEIERLRDLSSCEQHEGEPR